jgi:hypothetical protein
MDVEWKQCEVVQCHRSVSCAAITDLVIVSGEMSSNVIEPSGTDGTAEATHADARRWMRESIRSGDLTAPSPALSAHVEGCALCQGALLALIAAARELPPTAFSTTCEKCLEDLPAYIELELEDAMSALRTYPHVWWHLLTCRECAETYRLTRTLVEAERSGQLAAPPRPRQITFPNIVRLGRQILNRVLAPTPIFGLATRGGGGQPIVLAEEDDAQGYAITLSVQPQSDGAWRVLIRAVPPPVGNMVLTLGEATFQTAFDAKGIAVVPNVPAPLLVHPDGPDLVVGIVLDE